MLKVRTIESSSSNLVTVDDIIRMIDNNRARIRALGSMILAVAGLLLSSSFVVLFFLLKERQQSAPTSVAILLFGAILALMGAITLSLLSALLSPPAGQTTKLDLIDSQSRIALREFRRVYASAILLMFAIGLFTSGLIVFAIVVFR